MRSVWSRCAVIKDKSYFIIFGECDLLTKTDGVPVLQPVSEKVGFYSFIPSLKCWLLGGEQQTEKKICRGFLGAAHWAAAMQQAEVRRRCSITPWKPALCVQCLPGPDAAKSMPDAGFGNWLTLLMPHQTSPCAQPPERAAGLCCRPWSSLWTVWQIPASGPRFSCAWMWFCLLQHFCLVYLELLFIAVLFAGDKCPVLQGNPGFDRLGRCRKRERSRRQGRAAHWKEHPLTHRAAQARHSACLSTSRAIGDEEAVFLQREMSPSPIHWVKGEVGVG